MVTNNSDSDCSTTKGKSTFHFRKPVSEDGYFIHQLINQCPPLDTNSAYCNFLQTTHFRDTCIAAEDENGDIAGFISAYLVPSSPDTLFIWQVAIAEPARGNGLASKMVAKLLEREETNAVTRVETTITKNNDASWALFRKLDRQNGNRGETSVFLDKETHFQDKHDTEYLYRIPVDA
uniref:diaminobutyrate acetyltransferase n=1 Tax=Thaumasiovibrio occultus TaxID=1891184 RepID=UPI000B361D08|nr:diaminobutyrate acetyltransferase [Thaumasiovibrio occultus]